MNPAIACDWQTRRVRNWLLAILRFSLTLEPEDEAAAKAMADDIDRLGFVAKKSEFSFFLRISSELCSAIADQEYPGRNDVLRRHLARIDDPRLRRAFLAAVALEPQDITKSMMALSADRARRRA